MDLMEQRLPLSDFSNMSTLQKRMSGKRMAACPICGELRESDTFITPDGATSHCIKCGECGDIIIAPVIKRGDIVYRNTRNGEPYDFDAYINRMIEKKKSAADEEERTIIEGEIVRDELLTGDDRAAGSWYFTVDDFIGMRHDESYTKRFCDLMITGLFRPEYDFIDANMCLAESLIRDDREPVSVQECALWLWYVYMSLKEPDEYTDADRLDKIRGRAVEAYKRMDCSEMPYIRTLDLIWESRNIFRREANLRNRLDQSVDTEIEIAARSAMDSMYADLRKGIHMNSYILDLFFDLVDSMISSSEDPKGLIDELRSVGKDSEEYGRIIRNRCVYYDVMHELNTDVTITLICLRGRLLGIPDASHVISTQDALKDIEEITDIEYSGRTMIELYVLYALVKNDMFYLDVARSYARILHDNGHDHNDLDGRILLIMKAVLDNKKRK